MKLITLSILSLLMNGQAWAEEKVIADCGQYSIIHQGEFSLMRDGIIKRDNFVIKDPEGRLISVKVDMDDQSLVLTSETPQEVNEDGEVSLPAKKIQFDYLWGVAELQVELAAQDGTSNEVLSCELAE